MRDKIRDLGTAVTLIAMWIALAILLVKYMKLTKRAEPEVDEEKEDFSGFLDNPPSYAEVMQQANNRIECV